MADKSAETVIFSCKTSSAAFIPYILWGLAGLLILALSGVWQLGASVCGALIIYGFSAVSPGGLTVTDSCVRNRRAWKWPQKIEILKTEYRKFADKALPHCISMCGKGKLTRQFFLR